MKAIKKKFLKKWKLTIKIQSALTNRKKNIIKQKKIIIIIIKS